MKNLTELTLEELQTLIADVQKEISNREAKGKGFDAEFSRSSKAYHPCTYKQLQYAEGLAKKTGSIIEPTTSQMIKYFEMDDMSEAIEAMKEGKRIRIY